MGRKLTKIKVKPGRNEQIETTITLQKEARSVIHGVVLDERKCPVKDAVVKLFEMPNKDNCCTLVPLFHTFTDECGQFLFGPLAPGKQYVVKVWHSEVVIRKIPGTPFECKNPSVVPNHHHEHEDNCDVSYESDFFDSEDCSECDDYNDYRPSHKTSCSSCSINL